MCYYLVITVCTTNPIFSISRDFFQRVKFEKGKTGIPMRPPFFLQTRRISIYTLSDLSVLSNLIGSLSLAK